MSQVITRLMGGLGNQMFQYAAGKALATRLAVPLLVDRSFLDDPASGTTTRRELELDAFRLPLEFAGPAEVNSLRRAHDQRIHRLANRLAPAIIKDRVFRERGTGFDPAFTKLRGPVFLEGYWQNEQYFNSIADELRTDLFVPRSAPSARNAELLTSIQGATSASLHVRRGDYISDPNANSFHGVCSVDYYMAGAKELAAEKGVDHFFLFSDDPDWVKANIKLPYPTTHVAHNTGRDNHWDLFLMKHCAHHIIANSSFSWWGAWLNAFPGKVVIAPKRWFQGSDAPASDILPATWLAR